MINSSPSSAVVSLIHHFQARCEQLALMAERHLHLDHPPSLVIRPAAIRRARSPLYPEQRDTQHRFPACWPRSLP